MNTKLKVTSVFVFVMVLTACHSAWKEPLPSQEIIYQTGYYNEPRVIGAINGDGSNPELVPVGAAFRRPVWSPDSSLIFGFADAPGTGGQSGYPSYWSADGDYHRCSKWGSFEYIESAGNTNHSKHAFVAAADEIRRVDLESCEVLEVILTRDECNCDFKGISYYPATGEFLYGMQLYGTKPAKVEIHVLNLETGADEFLATGIHPYWSPDGKEIVYVQADGIYVMNANGTNSRLLVAHPFSDGSVTMTDVYTVPRWSPNGEWILYDRCVNTSCNSLETSGIYRISSSGGTEELIIMRGINPSWRP